MRKLRRRRRIKGVTTARGGHQITQDPVIEGNVSEVGALALGTGNTGLIGAVHRTKKNAVGPGLTGREVGPGNLSELEIK